MELLERTFDKLNINDMVTFGDAGCSDLVEMLEIFTSVLELERREESKDKRQRVCPCRLRPSCYCHTRTRYFFFNKMNIVYDAL